MIGFYDGNQYAVFREWSEFLNHVLTPGYSGWRIFAHFGGRFDVHFLFDYVRAMRPDLEVEFICSGSAVIALTIKQGKYYWRFCDSFRLMPSPLKKLTEEFKVAHPKLEFNPNSVEYNCNDCMGLWECLQVFFGMYGICSETIASHAMRIFRSQFLRRTVAQPRRDVEEFCRRAYHGGRCELYRHDRACLRSYDVNSMYGKCMTLCVPVEYLCRTRKFNERENVYGFYQAEVYLPESYFPPLPVHTDKLYFPSGAVAGIFTETELRDAIAIGAEVSIKDGVLFHAEPVLEDYARELYAMKIEAEREGNLAVRYVAKILQNSCYGKFGQRREQITYFLDRNGAEGAFPVSPESEACDIAYRKRESKAAYILPHISAGITALARHEILEHLRACPGPVWYSDTDSLYTTAKLRTGEKMGELKLEQEGIFEGYGPKEYCFAGSPKAKGIPKDDAFLVLSFLQGYKVRFGRMAGFLESLRYGENTARRVTQEKVRSRTRDKRCRVGVDSRPWRMEELWQT